MRRDARPREEFQEALDGFSSRLPWDAMVSETPGIVATHDGGLLTTWRLEPRDLGAMSTAEQWTLMQRINAIWKRLDGGWALWQDAHRLPVTAYPLIPWSHPTAAVVDDERREALTAPGARWETTVYLSVWHRPTAPTVSLLHRLFFTDPSRRRGRDLRAVLDEYRSDLSWMQALLTDVCETIEPLSGEALATYLHQLISLHAQPIRLPDLPIDLHRYLCDCALVPGILPQLLAGPTHGQSIRALTLTHDLPEETSAALFAGLLTMPFAYRWVTRWLPMGQATARKLTTKTQINWLSLQDNWRSWLYEARTGERVPHKDRHMTRQADDADIARDLMLSDEYRLGDLTMTFVLMREDAEVAEHDLRTLGTVVRSAGCVARDDPLNTLEVYLGSLPGLPYANVGSLRLTTLNLATMGPWHRPWPGVRWNTHLNAPPLCEALTEGCNRVGVDTHVGDLGDSLLIGPKGSGKSTALTFFDLCWFQAPDRQLTHFDVGESSRCLTLCLQGHYHDLGRGDMVLQVMADVDDPEERAWLFEWVLNRLEESAVPIDADTRRYVRGAMDRLCEQPLLPRTVRSLIRVMADTTRHTELMSNAQIDAEGKSRRDMRRDLLVQRGNQIIATLHDYAQGGLHGHLFDADVDGFTLGPMDTFTLDRLLKMPRAAPGLCEVIFHRMDRRVDGRPRRIVFDEFWVALGTAEDGMHAEATSLLAKSLSRLLAVGIPAWRRQNRSGMFALQSISQMEGHRLTPLLLESCQTRFFFPNAKAMDAKVQRAYEGMDLHAEEIRRNIALAQPKREVYFTRPDGRRLVDLALHPIARSICGANRAEDHVLMDTLLARYGPEEFPVHWLQAQGFPEAAHTVDRGLQHSRAQARADLLTVAADD